MNIDTKAKRNVTALVLLLGGLTSFGLVNLATLLPSATWIGYIVGILQLVGAYWVYQNEV